MQRRPKNESGFSLVEILVVLFIIGLMSAAVVLAFPKPKSELEQQAAILASQLNALAQDGLITGSVNAAGFSTDGYALYTFENSEWTERASGEWQESYRLTLTRASAKLDMPKDKAPIIMFQPTGLSTPFELTLADRETKYALKTEGNGRIALEKLNP